MKKRITEPPLPSENNFQLRKERKTKVLHNLAIVLPTLNEAESIGIVLDEIAAVFKGNDHYIVVVDGHSTDGTPEIAEQKGAIVIDQLGIGYGDALQTGFKFARTQLKSNLIAMMDADTTYDPKDIPYLASHIEKGGADLVIGNRFKGMEEGAMPWVNRLGNRFISWVARSFLNLDVYDTQSGLRVFKAELVDHLDLTKHGMPFATEMLAEAKFNGAKISEAPITYRPRIGVPKLSPLKDGIRILGTILRLMRDTRPLLFFGGIGLLMGLMGLILGVEITLQWFTTGTVGRLPTLLLSVLLLIGAMQLLTLGLVADMIKGLRRNNNRN